MDALVAVFIAWIVAQTGLAAPDPPRVVLVPKGEMLQMAFGSTKPRALRLDGLYNPAHRTIYLPDTWKPADLRQESVLLHELVHHVLRSNNVPRACDGDLERRAFDLQVAWLREQGVADPYKLIGTDAFTIFLLSRCESPDW